MNREVRRFVHLLQIALEIDRLVNKGASVHVKYPSGRVRTWNIPVKESRRE